MFTSGKSAVGLKQTKFTADFILEMNDRIACTYLWCRFGWIHPSWHLLQAGRLLKNEDSSAVKKGHEK